ncbi:hypothetical protein GQ42DRAFT_155877 [Ramicandelaber brevisporus]|nr:hypothetical protein GQ42DRAFT_155877 [Ramicandelaber brevisporus]
MEKEAAPITSAPIWANGTEEAALDAPELTELLSSECFTSSIDKEDEEEEEASLELELEAEDAIDSDSDSVAVAGEEAGDAIEVLGSELEMRLADGIGVLAILLLMADDGEGTAGAEVAMFGAENAADAEGTDCAADAEGEAITD